LGGALPSHPSVFMGLSARLSGASRRLPGPETNHIKKHKNLK